MPLYNGHQQKYENSITAGAPGVSIISLKKMYIVFDIKMIISARDE
jgi:hypothetical protein